jgi:hypothetical protein
MKYSRALYNLLSRDLYCITCSHLRGDDLGQRYHGRLAAKVSGSVMGF